MKPLISPGIIPHPTLSFSTPHARIPGPYEPNQYLIAALQSYLNAADLTGLQLFAINSDLFDEYDHRLITFACPNTAWVDLAPYLGPSSFTGLRKNNDSGKTILVHAQPYGLCHIPEHNIVIARAHCHTDELRPSWLTFIAAPGITAAQGFLNHIETFRQAQRKHYRRWVTLSSTYDQHYARPIDEAAKLDDLILSDTLVRTINQQVIGFFSPQIQSLHDRLGLPRVRKTIFYGPPGTGKTSLCQAIARAIPNISAYHLTPDSDFDDGDMSLIYKHVISDSPAILLIEDLDTLVAHAGARINTSNFLNLLDGVNSLRSGPALILATSNHPEKLPESLINRPGRFMPIEIPLPDRALRLRYLEKGLPGQALDFLQQTAARSQGLSFAHLQEVILLSGIFAMNDNRDTRTQDDILAALKHINSIGESAKLGFPSSSTTKPFGFTPRDMNTPSDTDAA